MFLKRNGNLLSFFVFIFQAPLSAMGFMLFMVFAVLYPGNAYYLLLHQTIYPQLVRDVPFSSPVLHPYPFLVNQVYPQNLTAESVAVVDVDSWVTMYAKNSRHRLLPASTTKIMTAVVALEHLPLDQVVTVSASVATTAGSKMSLVSGEQITVRSLLYGLLLKSGNDAAEALADSYPGGRKEFVGAMNVKARELLMDDTHFTNPVGLDNPDHYSTAADLARLASYALTNKTFASIVDTRTTVVSSVDGKVVHNLQNINKLLGSVEGVDGIKTGWTEDAGECLVASAVRKGHRIITVVLQSMDRFGESRQLIEWAYGNHEWRVPGEKGDK